MRIVSVNVGRPATLEFDGRSVTSAIVKAPVDGRVMVRRTNLDGDAQADLRVHGGADKAVYLYPAQHYAHWAGELGRELSPFGYFGENLTVEGADEAEARIGDVVRAGDALLEVSHPRVPCFKLAMRMRDHAFGKPFLASGRVGYYLRVLEEGGLASGDAIELISRGEGGFSVRRSAWMLTKATAEELDEAAALPALALGWRQGFAERAVAMRRRPTPA
ncbi:MAG TPA: MOSC domain-containing protein [Miltoncostaeaceae bacterium]|nr:MOSC domain-containing protein [Miltoncostaeaceae bacterium]